MDAAVDALPERCDTKNYGGGSRFSGGRRRKTTIFQRDWDSFATVFDSLLPKLNNVRNIIFYRAVHGMIYPLQLVQNLITACMVDLDRLYLVQIHLGLKISPPQDEALFVNTDSVRFIHKEADVAEERARVVAFHPGYVGLRYGHYR